MSAVRTVHSSLTVCPATLSAGVLVGAVFVGELLLPLLATNAAAPWIGSPVTVATLAVFISAVITERSYIRGSDCGLLPERLSSRLALYGLAFVVSLFVVVPGVSMSREVVSPLRVVGLILLSSLVAFLFLHRGAHRDNGGEPSKNTWPLVIVSRLPLFLLAGIVAFLLVVGVLEIALDS